MVDFIENLDRIELPNHLVTVLDDPLLLRHVNLKKNEFVNMRIDRQLAVSLGLYGLSNRGKDMKKIPEDLVKILQKSLKYSTYAKASWLSIRRAKAYALTYLGFTKVCRDVLGHVSGPVGRTET